MENTKWYIGSVFLGSILLFGFGSIISINADEHGYEHEEENEHEHENEYSKRVLTTQNALYKEECGSCHLAYPAALLPKKSWDKIMSNLENHFDENAELEQVDRLKIKKYLAANSLSTSRLNRLSKMLRNIPAKAPIRITKLPYFIRKHDEIPSRMVKGNPEVKSFSQCDKCHSGAERGDFEEDRVKIPNYGRWED